MIEYKAREPSLAALLVDLENLYLAMKDKYRNPADLTVTSLQALREHMENTLFITPVIGRAYAPMDYSSSRIFINDLALMGITPVHVLAYSSKNSADLMLAIDCMELLFRREDLGTFVIVGGDRDYIPVAERIRQNARRVFVVSPRHAMSGDLLTIIGEDNYLDPISLLPEDRVLPAVRKDPAPVASGEEEDRDTGVEPGIAEKPSSARERPVEVASISKAPTTPSGPPLPSTMAELKEMVVDSYELEDLKACTKLILEFRRDRNLREVWLGPFLRVMNEAFPLKSNAERKNLLNRIEDLGAIEIVERPRNDESGTYAVILVCWRHPLVVEMNLD